MSPNLTSSIKKFKFLKKRVIPHISKDDVSIHHLTKSYFIINEQYFHDVLDDYRFGFKMTIPIENCSGYFILYIDKINKPHVTMIPLSSQFFREIISLKDLDNIIDWNEDHFLLCMSIMEILKNKHRGISISVKYYYDEVLDKIRNLSCFGYYGK